jgi:hypothetical protein
MACNCDDSNAWKARAVELEAENRRLKLSLRFARRDIERLLGKVDEVLRWLPTDDGSDVTTLENGACGHTSELPPQAVESDEPMSPAVWTRVGNWMAARLNPSPKEQP